MLFSRSSLLAPSLISLLLSGNAVADDARTRARNAFEVLQGWYNPSSGIWDTTGWWDGANCMNTIADLAVLDTSVLDTARYVFNNTFNVGPVSNPHPGPETKTVFTRDNQQSTAVNASQWLDQAYDDDGWWALAWIAAYDVTKEQQYLELAEGIFESLVCPRQIPRLSHTLIETGESVGDQLRWRRSSMEPYKHLRELNYERAFPLRCSTSREPSSGQERLLCQLGSKGMGLVRSPGLYRRKWYHQRRTPRKLPEQWGYCVSYPNNHAHHQHLTSCRWSYNQGVILGGLVELNKAAPNDTYVPSADRIAKAAIETLTDSNNVIHDVCEPQCLPDGTQFKGIFIRNLAILQKVSPNAIYLDVINNCATSIWDNDRNEKNQFGVNWAGPIQAQVDASTHSSALDALVAAVAVLGA